MMVIIEARPKWFQKSFFLPLSLSSKYHVCYACGKKYTHDAHHFSINALQKKKQNDPSIFVIPFFLHRIAQAKKMRRHCYIIYIQVHKSDDNNEE